jgi:hypothetical protein
MRQILKERFERNPKERYKYKATFERFGKREGYKGWIKTVLLADLIDGRTHKLISDHLWMDCGKRFDKLDLTNGDMIQFEARTKIYKKGYEGYNEFGEKCYATIDYGLSYPSKIVKLSLSYIINN